MSSPSQAKPEEPTTGPANEDATSSNEDDFMMVSAGEEEASQAEEEDDDDESLKGQEFDDNDVDDDENDEDDGALPEGDSWIEELECALLADCDPTILKKISEGKRIPKSLRLDFWRSLLALNEAGPVTLCHEFDLPNQLEIRHECEKLVQELDECQEDSMNQLDRLKLVSRFQSTITTYIKARPELTFVTGNGWIDILKVLHHLDDISDSLLYQMFFRIVDRYIPKDLFKPSLPIATTSQLANSTKELESKANSNGNDDKIVEESTSQTKTGQQVSPITVQPKENQPSKQTKHQSIQAYHLLRLLIQYHDPALCSMLDSKKVTPNLYAQDWFCSLFARSCSTQLGLLIWDAHFKMADPFLIFFAAIVMVVNASDDLKEANQDQQSMLKILKTMPSKLLEDDIEDLYYLVSNHYTYATPRSIRSFSHLLFLDTFSSTYMGNESPIDGQPLQLDLKTSKLTSNLDLSRYLCLPIVPAEIFAIDSAISRKQSSAQVQQRQANQGNETSVNISNQETEPNSCPSSPTTGAGSSGAQLRYFLVDCRPAEQYNAGHLKKAFHLDCSLMLREPDSFGMAVNVLLDIQRQVVASKSNTGGQHICFIGSGHEEDDQYVNMVVASFLQKYQSKYVSIVVGGFGAIHDYVSSKTELKSRLSDIIVDHNPDLCKVCYTSSPEAYARFQSLKRSQNQSFSGTSSTGNAAGATGIASSLFSSTANFLRGDKTALSKFAQQHPQTSQLAQTGAQMFDRFAKGFVSKSSVFKDKLVESLAAGPSGLASNTSLNPNGTPANTRGHVSHQDRLGRRYTGSLLSSSDNPSNHDSPLLIDTGSEELGSLKLSPDGSDGGITHLDDEPIQEVQLDTWMKEAEIFASYKCSQIKGSAKYPGYLALSHSHLWVLREIPHNKGFASIAAKRPLDSIVQITSKRRQPELIIFRYGKPRVPTPPVTSQDQLESASQQQQQQEPGSEEKVDSTQVKNTEDESKLDQENSKNKNESIIPDEKPSTSQVEPAPPIPVDPIQEKPKLEVIASDHLHIPQPYEVIRLIKSEIVKTLNK